MAGQEANSVDPDEMPQNASIIFAQACLTKYMINTVFHIGDTDPCKTFCKT